VEQAAHSENAPGSSQPAAAGSVAADKAVDAALAEFNALRAEIIANMNMQFAIVGLGLTAIGIILGVVAREGAERQLLLGIPPLATAIVLLRIAASVRIGAIGDYIRVELWPYIQDKVGSLPSWEVDVERRRRSQHPITVIALNGPAVGLFSLTSLIALLFAGTAQPWLLAAGWACFAIMVAIPLILYGRGRFKGLPRGVS